MPPSQEWLAICELVDSRVIQWKSRSSGGFGGGGMGGRLFMALDFAEKESNGVTVVALSGRVTLGDESNKLRTKLKELLGAGKTRLVLDLAEVKYIDSAGLGTLVAGFTTARNQGANLKLANLTKKFDEQLHITKLVTVFDVYNSVEEAVKSFA
jgi:anti-sigma B factor antagonist